jgi:hypothetical protein
MIRRTAIGFAFVFAAAAQDQPAASPWNVPASVEIGVAGRTVDGENTSKFQEYRDVPRGAFLRRFDFSVAQPGNPFRLDFRSLDLGQTDGEAYATVEKWGRYRFTASFWGFQRSWSNHNSSVLKDISRGVFTAPVGLRGAITANPELARDAVLNAPQVEIRSWRERGTFAVNYNLGGNWSTRVAYMIERRAGNRLFTQGTYARIGTPQGDTFETPGQELWAPTAYRTQ